MTLLRLFWGERDSHFSILKPNVELLRDAGLLSQGWRSTPDCRVPIPPQRYPGIGARSAKPLGKQLAADV